MADSKSDMEMESSKVQEAEKVEETDEKTDPDLSVTQDDAQEAMKPEESEETPNAITVSALDTILKALWKISVFLSDFLLEFCQETHHSLTEDGEYVVLPTRQLRDFLLKKLSVSRRALEANGALDFLVAILELLPLWRSGNEPLNSKFEFYEIVKKICNRCKLDMEHPVGRGYGMLVDADSLREIESAFKDWSFEKILKLIRINLMTPCDKEGCGKRNYVERMINKPPSVFTIALQWENSETVEEIIATTSVLPTEIDISEIYKYEGDSVYTKYHLASMVCWNGDQYSCIGYEKGNWVIHFGAENEVIGEWNSVLSYFIRENVRPEILFFENVMGKDQTLFGSFVGPTIKAFS